VKRMSVEEARRLGLLDGSSLRPEKVRKRGTRKTAAGPYRSQCRCGEVFTTRAAEDRHVRPGHATFNTLLT
jgi:IS5 family transposase